MSTNVHYINEHDRPNNGRNLSATINEAKDEFKRFAETRIAMLQAEMKEKVAIIRASAPMMAIGALLGVTAFLVLTGALISLIWTAFAGNRFGPFLAFVIVGVIYAIVGGGVGMYGYKKLSAEGLTPDRTIKVLKDDKVWLQNEARTQL